VYPDFIFHQRGDASIWIARDYDDAVFLDRVSDADELFTEPGCQIVKDQLKTKIGRIPLSVAGRTRTLFLKRYNAFSLRYKLASPFIHSGAVRSLRGAETLRAAEIPCARAVAAVENRKAGALTKSFFITEEIAGGETVDAYWRERLRGLQGRLGAASRRRFLARLARLFSTLHGASVYHNDLKDANILAVGDVARDDFRFVLLDLDGVVRMTRLSGRRRVKNLMQINRTLGRYLRRPEKLFFLKSYLGSAFVERSARRELIVNVLAESSRVDRRMACRE
jgi:hypothetical protein